MFIAPPVGRTRALVCEHRDELHLSRLHMCGSVTHLDMGSPSGLSLALLVSQSGLKQVPHDGAQVTGVHP